MIQTYEFGAKNHWRRTIWNEIAKRVDNRRKAIAIYLPGKEDLDRSIAISKGFKPMNLIGIDRDASVVEKLRSEKKLIICGPAACVLDAWDSPTKPSAIFMDFQCGLTEEAFLTMACISTIGQPSPIICAANFLRGRDHDPLFDLPIDRIRAESQHRGEQFFSAMLHFWDKKVCPCCRHKLTRENLRCKFFSYKSAAGNQYFDSIVFDWPLTRASKPTSTEYKQQISACLAVRTMRINGTL